MSKSHQELIEKWKTEQAVEIFKSREGSPHETLPMKEGVTQCRQGGNTGKNNNGGKAGS